VQTGRLRGVTLTLLVALLTAIGHVAAGGGLPDLSLLVVLLPLLGGAFVALAERTRSFPATLGVLAAGQLVIHAALAALHPMAADGTRAMLVLHVLVTLVTAVAVRYADAAVLAVAATLRRVVPRRLTPPPADRPLPTRPVPPLDLPARRARLLTVAVLRRGPPVWA
jgi:hypothetical protein